MSPGDWIALATFGLTGFAMFCTLLGVIWKWSSSIERRLAIIEMRLGLDAGTQQTAQSARRLVSIGALKREPPQD